MAEERLSTDQKIIIDLATNGHNVYFGGIGGCGKTFVANCIIRVLKTRKVKFACTCTTGIACTLYNECNAQTIHSLAGIGACHGSKEELLRNILLNEECVKRWRETEVLLIDEISMMSQRTFEILQYIALNIRGSESDYAFGGLQVIAFGDFLQLPPVPNSVDYGKYSFQSVLWNVTFPHQVILHESFRAHGNNQLLRLIKELSVGNYSDENVELIKSLNRPLNPADLGLQYVTQLFPLNDDVDFANACILDGLPGQQVVFDSYDIGDIKAINRELVATQKLALKIGAQVMFIYNINDNIKNGVLGTVVAFLNDLPVVKTDLETIVVNKVTWPVYDRSDSCKVIGTRTQIPLKLAWAMTIHKAQGKTLPAVEVHCNNLFAPGHLYVALSRVKAMDKLSVIGFYPEKHQIPPPKVVLDYLKNINNATAYNDCMCCRVKVTVQIGYLDETVPDEMSGNQIDEDELNEIDEVVKSYFIRATTTSSSDSESTPENVHKIPEDFDYSAFILSLKNVDDVPEIIGSVTDINMIYDNLLCPDVISNTKLFLDAQWSKILEIIRKYVPDNVNTVVRRKQFTFHFGELHNFICSKELETEFGKLIGTPVNQLSEQHFHALTEIVFSLNKRILTILGAKSSNSQVENQEFSVRSMNDDGLGKVRYCGAWAVAKIRNSCKIYFRSNIHSSNSKVRMKAKEAYIKAELLSQVICSSSVAQENSNSKETLNITLQKTYDKGNLVHVTDNMFEWIIELEQERVNILNKKNLSVHQNDLVEHVLSSMMNNQELLKKWKALFSIDEILSSSTINLDSVHNLVSELLRELISRYVKMGVGEFLREFRRDFQLQKTEAHRKKVVEKKKKKDLLSSKVTLESIKVDNSTNKKNSHSHLLTMIDQQEMVFRSTVYTKSEIQLLCKAYNLHFRKNDSKSTLSEKLIPAIQQSHFIPNPLALCNGQEQSSASAIPVESDNHGLACAQNPLQGNSNPLALCNGQEQSSASAIPVESDNHGLACAQNPLQDEFNHREESENVQVHAPPRKRFKPSKDEEEVLRIDQQANKSMERAYERSIQFKTSLKSIISWHEKHPP